MVSASMSAMCYVVFTRTSYICIYSRTRTKRRRKDENEKERKKTEGNDKKKKRRRSLRTLPPPFFHQFSPFAVSRLFVEALKSFKALRRFRYGDRLLVRWPPSASSTPFFKYFPLFFLFSVGFFFTHHVLLSTSFPSSRSFSQSQIFESRIYTGAVRRFLHADQIFFFYPSAMLFPSLTI